MPGLRPGRGQHPLPLFIGPTAPTATLWMACGVCATPNPPPTSATPAGLSTGTYRKPVHSCHEARAEEQEQTLAIYPPALSSFSAAPPSSASHLSHPATSPAENEHPTNQPRPSTPLKSSAASVAVDTATASTTSTSVAAAVAAAPPPFSPPTSRRARTSL